MLYTISTVVKSGTYFKLFSIIPKYSIGGRKAKNFIDFLAQNKKKNVIRLRIL